MGKKVKTQKINENCSSHGKENTIPLDSTSDTDIIESSILDENKYDFIKRGKLTFNNPNFMVPSKQSMNNGELKNNYNSPEVSINTLRLSLRINYKLADGAESGRKQINLSTETPTNHNKNSKQPESTIKKLISTLKKTPEGPLLSKSKLRNIEQWLNENAVETVCTPPFANLSVTPVNSLKKRFSPQWKYENKKLEENSFDSEVEGVLKAVYGDDWKRKNVRGIARTEPQKKTKFFSPVSHTKKKDSSKCCVRRNILSESKFNLSEKSDQESSFDDSLMSGVKIINLDSSSCSHEQMKLSSNHKRITRRKKKGYTTYSSPLSLCQSPKTKKPRTKPLVNENNKKQTPKTSTKKKFPSEVEFKTPKKTFLASLSVSTPTSRCHPDAQYYKINFKSKKEELVKKLFKLYNLEVFDGKLPEDLNFSWNIKLRGTAGYCYNKRITKSTGEIIRVSRIEFSSKIIDRADRLRDTMIHELCHAASWVIDGVLDGHGRVWSKWADRAMNRFSELPAIKRCHNYEILSKYVYRCTGCGYSIKRHSKSINIEKKRCGYCYGALELLINKKKKGKGEVPEFDTTKTLPTPNKFAIFVKENYHSVRSSKSSAKHSEIMRILSQEYALFKNGLKSQNL